MADVAAFFDLDRTLIDVNSGMLYVRHEYRAGRLGRLKLAQSMMYMFLYHMAFIDMEKVYGQAVSFYKGESAELLDERTRSWFDAEVKQRIQPGAQVALDEHRARGEPCVLLTSSSNYVSQVALETWQLDAWIANSFPTDAEGKLLGTFEAPLCYGPGKVTRAEAWAAERGIDLDNSWFYTDSYTDVPMLERVQNPRIVNPDPRLRRLARKRGWPILDWSQAPERS